MLDVTREFPGEVIVDGNKIVLFSCSHRNWRTALGGNTQ